VLFKKLKEHHKLEKDSSRDQQSFYFNPLQLHILYSIASYNIMDYDLYWHPFVFFL